jgi:hypothetical protein
MRDPYSAQIVRCLLCKAAKGNGLDPRRHTNAHLRPLRGGQAAGQTAIRARPEQEPDRNKNQTGTRTRPGQEPGWYKLIATSGRQAAGRSVAQGTGDRGQGARRVWPVTASVQSVSGARRCLCPVGSSQPVQACGIKRAQRALALSGVPVPPALNGPLWMGRDPSGDPGRAVHNRRHRSRLMFSRSALSLYMVLSASVGSKPLK